jgi:ankyrin repeat protein
MKFFNTKKGKIILGIVLLALLGYGIQHFFGYTWLGGRPSVMFFKDPLARRLADAAARGQADKIAALVKQGANPNYVGDGNVTIMFWAIASKNEPGVKALLKNGADPNQVTVNGDTYLTFLSDSTLDSQIFRDMINDLVDAGADVNKPTEGGD